MRVRVACWRISGTQCSATRYPLHSAWQWANRILRENFGDQGSTAGMVPADTLMNVEEYILVIFLLDTPLEHLGDDAFVELAVDDG